VEFYAWPGEGSDGAKRFNLSKKAPKAFLELDAIQPDDQTCGPGI
jgi:hypothetical protein